MNRGVLYGIVAYGIWGLLPIYWKLLSDVPAFEIMSQRIIWLLVILITLLLFRQQWSWLSKLRQGRVLFNAAIAAFLLAINWFVYIWGVNAGFILETSLGYFINPLVNVLLGVLILGERIRPTQWLAVGIAAMGVFYLTVSYGSLPWIALTLAFSFGLYGLIKKRAPLGSLDGLTVEAALLVPFAFGYLLWLASNGQGAFGHSDVVTMLLLVGSGLVTAVPLLCFGAAAQRIPLTVLGFLQYLAPSLQFLIGVYIYHESFTQTRLIGFGIIWLALIIFSLESVIVYRRRLQAKYAV